MGHNPLANPCTSRSLACADLRRTGSGVEAHWCAAATATATAAASGQLGCRRCGLQQQAQLVGHAGMLLRRRLEASHGADRVVPSRWVARHAGDTLAVQAT